MVGNLFKPFFQAVSVKLGKCISLLAIILQVTWEYLHDMLLIVKV